MNIKFNFESPKNKETEVLTSKAGLVINKFKKWIENKGIDLQTLNTEDSIKEALLKNRLLFPGVTAEEVIAELKKSGFIQILPPKKVVEPAPEIIHIETEFQKLEGVKTIEDENIQKVLEENKFFQELEKNIFNEKELDTIYDQIKKMGKENSTENEQYYDEFVALIKGGIEEIKKDIKELTERKNQFKKNTESLGTDKAKRLEIAKKIATIIERAVAYGVSHLGWYGENVTIEPTSEFDDVKRRVDAVLEISKKDEDESSFMGLGIDVTYRGLLSEQYKEKLFVLLKSIQDGQKTKIKYHKNHNGEMMKEFSVPKIILFFNIDDVKDLVYMVKNINDPKVHEELKNSHQKFAVMNQMIIQCETLSSFAEESRNDIFRKYTEIVSSIKELAWTNPELKQILDARHEDEVSKHMKFLIEEFKIKHLTTLNK